MSKASPVPSRPAAPPPRAGALPQNDKRKLPLRFAELLDHSGPKSRTDCARLEVQKGAGPTLEPRAVRGPEPENAEPRPALLDPIEPFSRVLAQPVLAASPASPPGLPPPAALLNEQVLLDQLVRRLSWGGNGRRGSARLELGAGHLAGATVVLHVEGREVALEVEGGAGAELEGWRAKLVERLEARGLVVR